MSQDSVHSVHLKPWLARFAQQYVALLRKNLLVAWRSRRATLLRILAPVIFLAIVLLIDFAIRADESNSEEFRDLQDPDLNTIDSIRACHDDQYIKPPCYDFVYSPGDDPAVQAIVQSMRERNTPPIPDSRVKAFGSIDETNAWLLANPERASGGLHFNVIDASNIALTLQGNHSAKIFRNQFQDPNYAYEMPLQVATQREMARYLAQQAGTPDVDTMSLDVGWKLVAHPALNAQSIVGAAMGTFLFAANLFSFVIAMTGIVSERENKLTGAMTGMGMLTSAHWLSWATWEVAMSFVISLLTVAAGAAFQIDFFLDNSFGNTFLVLFLFQLAMCGFAFFMASFLRKSTVAVILGYAVFLLGWVMQLVVIFGFPYSEDQYKKFGGSLTVLFSFVPWAAFAKGINDLGNATTGGYYGIGWSERYSYCQRDGDAPAATLEQPGDLSSANDGVGGKRTYILEGCVLPLGDIYLLFLGQFLAYFLLAVYLHEVLPDANGVRKTPFYFLLPSYWNPKAKIDASSISRRHEENPRPAAEDADVIAEADRMRVRLQDGDAVINAEAAVQVFGLQRRFNRPEFWAITDSWFEIKSGQLFCLLGPNGAGKSTTINVLTGVLPPSGGDAVVGGYSLTSPGGLEQIRRGMGVCPQFDVLWAELTAREHLRLFGHIKGLRDAEAVNTQAEDLLKEVNLTYAATTRAGAFSGGMMRRLSVAVALLGDPSVVYLDEPTTGMDPISRRQVWDIIERAKRGRAIVLTTHSMEEADILGDRIAIMARGSLRCLGTSLSLKQKFGAGYQVSISVMSAAGGDEAAREARSARVKAHMERVANVQPSDENKAYITYLISRAQGDALPAILRSLEENTESLGITDVQMALCSLDEVFLNIAHQADKEAEGPTAAVQ